MIFEVHVPVKSGPVAASLAAYHGLGSIRIVRLAISTCIVSVTAASGPRRAGYRPQSGIEGLNRHARTGDVVVGFKGTPGDRA